MRVWGFIVLWMLLVGPVLPAAAAPGFDVAAYRIRAATDRAAGIAEGRSKLAEGVLDADPQNKRLLLWYMGGAAIGAGDDVALDEVLTHLDRMRDEHGDAAADSYAGFLRGSHLIDTGEAGAGLVLLLEAANRSVVQDSLEMRITAASELCRGFTAAGLPQRAREHCRRHTRLVAPLGDRAVLARAEYLEASALSNSGAVQEAIGVWRSAYAHFRDEGLDGLAARTAGSLSADLIENGEYAEALQMGREALDAATATASAVSLAIAHGVVAEALLGLGRLAEAHAEVNQGLAAAGAEVRGPVVRHLLLTKASILRAMDGDLDEVRHLEVQADEAGKAYLEDADTRAGELSSLEAQYREREQQVRIRELENENRERELALEHAQIEAERRQMALQHQRVVAWLAGVASLFLLGGLIVLVRLLRAQQRLAAVLRAQARQDALTGAANRRVLVEAGEALLREPGAECQGHVLMVVDVDHFKQVNDRHGHPLGDAVLVAITAHMQKALPEAGLVARIGGEEFAVLCPRLGIDRALAWADEVRLGVAELGLLDGDTPMSVSISVGVAEYCLELANFSAWFGAADAALYRAKTRGRNRVERWTPTQDTDMESTRSAV